MTYDSEDDMAQSGVGSPGYDKSPLQTMKRTTVAKQEAPPSRIVPNKRKGYHDQLRESSELERASRERIATIQTQGKTERQDIKESKRRKLAIEVEDRRSRNMREENLMMRQHELAMMDRKLELAHLQQGPQQQYGQADFGRSQPTNYHESQFSNSPSDPYHGFRLAPFDNTFTGQPSNTPYDAYSTDSPDTPTASSRSSVAP